MVLPDVPLQVRGAAASREPLRGDGQGQKTVSAMGQGAAARSDSAVGCVMRQGISEAAFYNEALPYILLDMFSDFDIDKDEMPQLSHSQIDQWFEFERIQGVMDYSLGRI